MLLDWRVLLGLLLAVGIIFLFIFSKTKTKVDLPAERNNGEKDDDLVGGKDKPDGDLIEGDLDLSNASEKPVCSFCSASLGKIHYISVTRDVIYSCPGCKKILSIANNDNDADE